MTTSTTLTHRQRFLNTMHYRTPDRYPLYDFNFWDETIPIWYDQGLDRKWTRRNIHELFELDASLGGGDNTSVKDIGSNVGLLPAFEHEVLQDLGDEEIVRQGDGALVRRHKHHVSIPPHVGHTLVDRQSWTEHYLPKLDPDDPARLPADFAARVAMHTHPDRDYVLTVNAGSLFGWLRDWMGMENIALVPYDDSAWLEEMVTTLADVTVAVLTKIFESGMRPDWCTMWEDMCYNSGPLLGPDHFKQYLVPHYRRITDICYKYGCDVISVDCDGKIDALVPHWLDAGVNCMFPIEIGNWADPVDLRERFGKEMLMMGGFDKHILAQTPDAIDAEILRLTPLVESGGYIPFCDHRVPPDVPLVNYQYYCKRAGQVWGKRLQ
ncbi:MAG TPA: hypothetical protein DCM28_23505 [Phycisphaerales bacterium]|nr:hypothetical protein [Phycisphaerales bacterium]HCD31411.1 hypothetical protein [Phycisphaerales bacterium]